VHRLAGVVRALLAFRGESDEEARVEAPRAARRGDPVAVIGKIASGDVEIFCFEQLVERFLSPVHQAFDPVWRDLRAVFSTGQKNPGFLEAFADRSNVIGKATR
jgi:hypothetical protein